METNIRGNFNGKIDVTDIEPVVIHVTPEHVDQKLKECAYCKLPFKPTREGMKYCSTSCRQKAHYHKHKTTGKSLLERVRLRVGNVIIRFGESVRGFK